MESEAKEFVRKQGWPVWIFETAIVLVILGLVGLIGYRVLFLTWTDNYEIPYVYDSRTGEIYETGRTGYIRTWPIVQSVHTVDSRPMQVCINANQRVLNCKLVQFNPKGLRTFLRWHGRNDYGVDSLNPILLSYAYDGSAKNYDFLTVIRELKPEEKEEQH